jgi:hypothetical protein
MKIRDDLRLAAYAYSLGYEVRGERFVDLRSPGGAGMFNSDGIPPESLQFIIGDVHVWDTARGWRVARLIDGLYEKPSPSGFFAKLKDALDEGARNWRDR